MSRIASVYAAVALFGGAVALSGCATAVDSEEPVDVVNQAVTSPGELLDVPFGIASNPSWKGTYKVYLPAGYRESTRSYPWMIFFVGSGEQASNIDKYGPIAVIKSNGNQAPAGFGMEDMIFGVSTQPQDKNNNTNMEVADTLYRLMVQTYRVDVSRLSLTGLSMGGNGVHEFIKRWPERVSSAVILSAANTTTRISDAQACLSYGGPNGVPLWLVHGTLDSPGWGISPTQTNRLYEVIKACNPPPAQIPRYSLVVGRSHEAALWNETYFNTGSTKWTLQVPGLDPLDADGNTSIYDWAKRQFKNTQAPDRNLGLNRAATASSVYQAYTPEKAFDGDSNTIASRWLSTPDEPLKWLTVDLGQIASLSKIVVKTGYGGGYAVMDLRLLACTDGACQPSRCIHHEQPAQPDREHVRGPERHPRQRGSAGVPGCRPRAHSRVGGVGSLGPVNGGQGLPPSRCTEPAGTSCLPGSRVGRDGGESRTGDHAVVSTANVEAAPERRVVLAKGFAGRFARAIGAPVEQGERDNSAYGQRRPRCRE